ncbi:MAG TPA: lytic murein transglycosylase B, partial [Nitrococcus sp.]|nr:lytic murein transglycosylase B [Nitrococcus sp.]
EKKQYWHRLSGSLFVLVMAILIGCAHADTNAPDTKAFENFAQHMAAQYGFRASAIEHVLAQSKRQDDILTAIAHPAEALPWYRYQPIFLQESRIRQGVIFWKQNQAALERAWQQYGVPPQIIVAILGVETRYGSNRGKYRVIDALRTLAFDYPPRSGFFRRELEQYLLLSREEGFDPLQPEGSYAGAMGMPQFISSSYRAYAVDFNGDGHRDLWDQPADAIGSVANYFKAHGWRRGEAVAVPASVAGTTWSSNDPPKDDPPKLEADSSVAALGKRGVIPTHALPSEQPAGLVILEGKQSPEYWIGLPNFYVITRYNHSALYAMAVYQLSEAIKQQWGSAR